MTRGQPGGKPATAQLKPKLVSPIRRKTPPPTGVTRGPPLSPWQVSCPPVSSPAQTIVTGSISMSIVSYVVSQSVSSIRSTFTSWSVSLLTPSGEVVPQPVAHVFSSPGAHAVDSALPAIRTGLELVVGDGDASSAKTTSHWLVSGS